MGKYERAVWRDDDRRSSESDARIARGQRPQDPHRDGSGLIFETLEHGGNEPDMMPQAIRVTDEAGRSCLYVPATDARAGGEGDYVALDPNDTWLGG